MGIQQQTHRLLFPPLKLIGRQRLKKFRSDLNLVFPRAGLTVADFFIQSDEAYHRLFPAGNNDFLALAGLLDQPRELSLGFVDRDLPHISPTFSYLPYLT